MKNEIKKENITLAASILADETQNLCSFFEQKPFDKFIGILRVYNLSFLNRDTSPVFFPDLILYEKHVQAGMKKILDTYFGQCNPKGFFKPQEKYSNAFYAKCRLALIKFGYIKVFENFLKLIKVGSHSIHCENRNIIRFRPVSQNMNDRYDFLKLDEYIQKRSKNAPQLHEILECYDENELDGAYFDAIKVQLESNPDFSSFEDTALFNGIPFISYKTALICFIIHGLNECSSFPDYSPTEENYTTIISDEFVLKNKFLEMVNYFQKRIAPDLNALTKDDINKIFNTLVINNENYKLVPDGTPLIYFPVKFHPKYIAQMSLNDIYDYIYMPTHMCKFLSAMYPKDVSRNQNQREDIMFKTMQETLCKQEPDLQLLTSKKLKNKNNKNDYTDIDAIIFNKKSQQVYFTQFKYIENYVGNITEKGNKVNRLCNKIEKWINDVNNWQKENNLCDFLKSIGLKNVKPEVKLNIIIMPQYNASQLKRLKLETNTIFTTAAEFYLEYDEIKDIDKTFKKFNHLNAQELKNDSIILANEKVTIGDYKFIIDNANSELIDGDEIIQEYTKLTEQ